MRARALVRAEFRCEGVAARCSQAAPDVPQQSTEQKLFISPGTGTEQPRGRTQGRASEKSSPAALNAHRRPPTTQARLFRPLPRTGKRPASDGSAAFSESCSLLPSSCLMKQLPNSLSSVISLEVVAEMTPTRQPSIKPSPVGGAAREERLSQRGSAVGSLILWGGHSSPQTAVSRPGRVCYVPQQLRRNSLSKDAASVRAAFAAQQSESEIRWPLT